jgi:predicted S18 family serine protease
MKKTRSISDITIAIIAVFLLGVVTGVMLTGQRAIPFGGIRAATIGNQTQVQLSMPAIDDSGNGVLGKLTTEVRPGSGEVLVNIANIIALGDTLQSAQNAVRTASQYTHTDLSNVDVIFNIEVNATAIEGPSAGVNMALSTIFALTNQTPRSDVMMTGTIDENGNIGQVGGVLEKARAAKAGGATVFVVPPGQSTDSETVRTRQCRQVGQTTSCRIIYETRPVNIGQKLNMTVAEASNIGQAVQYFEGKS